jgi:tRNA(fMet)-specific endonuclease VapC
MHTFILDTCIWSYCFYSEKYPIQHANIESHLKALPSGTVLGISIITWGEVAHGYNVVGPESLQSEYLQFIKAKGPKTFNIDMHTALKYGQLRAMLFEKYAPKKKRKKNLRPEQAIDPVTAKELGIDENDLWIAAQAITRNLTLVTNDKLKRIREVAKVAGDDLDIKNWAS